MNSTHTELPAETFSNFWSEPAPIRNQTQNNANRYRLLRGEYSKFRFTCDEGKTKWVRILPNTRNSQYPGQWVLPHQVVYFPDNVQIIDPRFFTGRTSPFFEFSLRLKRSTDPQLAALYRTKKNPNGIATWPRDMGIARGIEIPTDDTDSPKIRILHLSASDGTFGASGAMHRLIELAQAVNDDPSQPREILGTPKYKYPIVHPEHGRVVGFSRGNTYTVKISDNEDFLSLNQRITEIAKRSNDPDVKEAIEMATQVGLEHLLYPTTEEEAHQLLQSIYPNIYPSIFPERVTHHANGVPNRLNPPEPREPQPQPNGHHDPLAEAVRSVQQNAGVQPLPPNNPPHPGFADTIGQTANGSHADRFPETTFKAPPANLSDTQPDYPESLAHNDPDDQDAILNELLGNPQPETHLPPAEPYENKNKMAFELNKLPKFEINSPEYLAIKARLWASGHIVQELTPKHHQTLKTMIGPDKYKDLFPSPAQN